jgi:hypothetical protein
LGPDRLSYFARSGTRPTGRRSAGGQAEAIVTAPGLHGACKVSEPGVLEPRR